MSDKMPKIKVKIGGIFNATNSKEYPQISLEVQRIIQLNLDVLGLDGTIDIQFVPTLDHIKINDQRCDYSDHALEQIKRYTDHVGKNRVSNSASFWELLFQGVLFKQAAVLFTDDHLEKCLSKCAIQSNSFDEKKQWTSLFKSLLNMHISLKNKELIARIIKSESVLDSMDLLRLKEKLIDELQTNKIDILVSKKYFQSITREDTFSGKDNLFYMMRDGLYYELGITYPDFNLEFADLPNGIVQFRINDQLTLPMIGIGENEILVNDTINRLRLMDKDIVGTEIKNPANSNEGTLVDNKYQTLVDRENIYKWDAIGYFILLFSKTLRDERATFVTQSFLQKQLDKLKSYYDRNIELILNQNPISFLTQVFRSLVAENISIRNIKGICNYLLQNDWIQADESQHIIFDDRIPTMDLSLTDRKKDTHFALQYVRNNLKQYISHQVTRGQNTLNVFLLEPEKIENRIREELEQELFPSSELHDQLLLTIDREIKKIASSHKIPSILTTSSLRSYVRMLTQYRYPELTVLSYQELSPSMNIQPIARLSLS